ncbi:carboxypeptidase regulatory-like domain-containing protein [Spongisporangium articulatum]|uniref:alpha-amylase n=1 Tax=Spongisporangium articulatum TaxID=3362603 RepID=A0ABW8AR88_9ACTN
MRAFLRKRRLSAGRPGTGDDGGFGIIEVVVAMVLFAIMVPATVSVMASTTGGVTDNRSRVVAASLASSQIEMARSQAASVASETTTRVVGKVTYTIAQTVTTSTASATLVTCSSATLPAVYKLVTVNVTWPSMGSVRPVRSDTVVRGTASGTGGLAVTIIDSSGNPVPNLPVQLSNGNVLTTDSNGCVIFTNLPPGTYTVVLDQAGYVGGDGSQHTTSDPVNVTKDTVSTVSMGYDQGVSLAIKYVDNSGQTLSKADDDQLPLELKTATVSGTKGSKTVSIPGSVTGLYPATYTVTSGKCTLGSKDMSSGVPTSQTLQIPTAGVQVAGITTIKGIGAVTAVYKGPATGSGDFSCTVGTTFKIGYMFSLIGDNKAYLPLGKWVIMVPWNELGVILSIPGLTDMCVTANLTSASTGYTFIDVDAQITKMLSGLFTGGSC